MNTIEGLFLELAENLHVASEYLTALTDVDPQLAGAVTDTTYCELLERNFDALTTYVFAESSDDVVSFLYDGYFLLEDGEEVTEIRDFVIVMRENYPLIWAIEY